MFPLMNEKISLSPSQLAAATSAMLQIAHIDGACTAEEVALIRTFYGDAEPSFDTLLGSFAGTTPSAADLPDADARETVLALCILVAYADGAMSDPELAALNTLATDLGVDSGHFAQLLALVKDGMLSRLSGLPDAGSVAVVAGELG